MNTSQGVDAQDTADQRADDGHNQPVEATEEA